jgi:hypothetical protein
MESRMNSSLPETILQKSKEWKFGTPLSQRSPQHVFLEKNEKSPTRVVSQQLLTTNNPLSKLKSNNNDNTNDLTNDSKNNNHNVANNNRNQKQTQPPHSSANNSGDKKDRDPFNIFEPRL